MRDRAAVVAELRSAADAIERDEAIPVPNVSLHFMTHSDGITDERAALLAAAAPFDCEWELSVSHSEIVDTDFLNLHGELAGCVRIDIGGHADKLAARRIDGRAWVPVAAIAALAARTEDAA